MRLNILALIASVALIAACETAPEESAAASGRRREQTGDVPVRAAPPPHLRRRP